LEENQAVAVWSDETSYKVTQRRRIVVIDVLYSFIVELNIS